jgi:hypothetical protein
MWVRFHRDGIIAEGSPRTGRVSKQTMRAAPRVVLTSATFVRGTFPVFEHVAPPTDRKCLEIWGRVGCNYRVVIPISCPF